MLRECFIWGTRSTKHCRIYSFAITEWQDMKLFGFRVPIMPELQLKMLWKNNSEKKVKPVLTSVAKSFWKKHGNGQMHINQGFLTNVNVSELLLIVREKDL